MNSKKQLIGIYLARVWRSFQNLKKNYLVELLILEETIVVRNYFNHPVATHLGHPPQTGTSRYYYGDIATFGPGGT
uniref:Uncharacterized protein n=1 Tax=Oryza meridionalis TaxID=40149 RepID=A0A0E0EE03_9ORYZ